MPDFSTLSCRQKTLAVNIPYHGSKGPLHLLIDSTRIKVEGEGEWHARKHGGRKRRIWRKIHLGIDEDTLEIRAVEITGSHFGDAPILPDLLDQIPEDQDSVASRLMAPTRRASATMRLQIAVPMPSSRHARTQSPGRRKPLEPSLATRPCGRPIISGAPYGDDGVDTTAEAASRRRYTV